MSAWVGRKMIVASCLAILTCAGLFAACTSGAGDPTESSRAGHPDGVPQDTVKYSRDHLSGFGATRESFDEQHRPDSNANLDPRCCYVPVVKTTSGFRDTYNVAGSSPDLINLLTRYFPSGTDQ